MPFIVSLISFSRIIAARTQNGWVDQAVMTVALIGVGGGSPAEAHAGIADGIASAA